MNIKLYDVVERTCNYPFQKIDDEIIIIDPQNRLMHQLDNVASRVWEILTRKCSVQEMIDIIIVEYEVDVVIAQKDLVKIVGIMIEKKLIRIISG
jgi:hypothetical protein